MLFDPQLTLHGKDFQVGSKGWLRFKHGREEQRRRSIAFWGITRHDTTCFSRCFSPLAHVLPRDPLP